MKAYVLNRYEKRAALTLVDWPEPELRDNDILIEVHASGLNPLDARIRDGAFKALLPYKPPLILGHDVAGRVIAVGPGVRRFKVGDAVFTRPRDGRIGGFAERIAVDEADAALVPDNLSMAEAASVPLVGLTAWQALVEMAQVQPGQKVLIHAGSGGVGTFAIQLARHLGAVVATTTSGANADLVRVLGAEIVVDYRREAFDQILSGYDVVLNSLDANTQERSLKVLKAGGKLISLSGPPDPAFARTSGLNWPMRQVIGLMSRDIRRKARARGVDYGFLFMRADGDQLAKIAALLQGGAVRPVIDRVYPFEELADAFAHMDAGRAKGKIVIAASTGA